MNHGPMMKRVFVVLCQNKKEQAIILKNLIFGDLYIIDAYLDLQIESTKDNSKIYKEVNKWKL